MKKPPQDCFGILPGPLNKEPSNFMLMDITLPAFGSSVGEASITQWLVSVGDKVEPGQVIAEIETDKAMAELEAPEAGIIESIEMDEGSNGVEVGTVLALLRVTGEKPAFDSGNEVSAPEPDPEVQQYPVTSSEDVSPGRENHSSADSMEKVSHHLHAPTELRNRVKASPYARKLAAEQAIGLDDVAGSGPGGRIVSRDLEPIATSGRSHSSPFLDTLGYAPDSYQLTALSKMRRAIAEGLKRSVQEIPHYTLTVELDFEAVLEHRRTVNRALEDKALKVSVNDYLIWACARALKEVPAANSSWTNEGIARHYHANIAVAVAIEDGLVAPVIHKAESMGLEDIARAAQDIVQRTRDRKLKNADLTGATFTVSNLGMMGIQSFTSILSQPQACILSVGAVEARPVVRNGKIEIVHCATCTLTSDHRVVDGAVGASFLQHLREHLSSLAV